MTVPDFNSSNEPKKPPTSADTTTITTARQDERYRGKSDAKEAPDISFARYARLSMQKRGGASDARHETSRIA